MLVAKILQTQLALLSLSLLVASSEEKKAKLVPPTAASEAASLGLALYELYVGEAGTDDLQLPQALASQSSLAFQDIHKMLDFFENTQFCKDGQGWENKEYPSADWIRWLLMGGDAGKHWAETAKELAGPLPRKRSYR